MTPAQITARVTEAIRPQLEALEALYDRYDTGPRVIGKHHPAYDTVAGRLSYINRQLTERLGPQAALYAPGGPRRLVVKCPTPDCPYDDAGFDYDLIMTDYLKHRAECQNG